MAIELQPLELTYGFDDVSIIPGDVTINPEMVNISTEFCGIKLTVPILAAAMDGVVSPQFARQMRQLGGLAVLNLEGIHTRYADPEPIYEQIANASKDEAESLLQRVYSEPIKDNLIADVVAKLSADGQQAVVSVTPVLAKKLAPIVQEAGAAVLVIQSTVTTARHKSHSPVGLRIDQLTKELKIPVVIGNTVSYEVSLELMEQGISGLLVGVGPRRGLYQPRSPRHRSPPDIRHYALRRRPRPILQGHRTLCTDRYRRRYSHRRRHQQVAGRRSRRRYDRQPLRQNRRGPG